MRKAKGQNRATSVLNNIVSQAQKMKLWKKSRSSYLARDQTDRHLEKNEESPKNGVAGSLSRSRIGTRMAR